MRTPVPRTTLDWLLAEENPAVAVLARRTLLGEEDTPETAALWTCRNGYAPVAAILEAMRDDGSWDVPQRDYQKYRGNLWQIVFLGELWADGEDERVRRAAGYAFSRQLPDGSWSCSNGRPHGSITCLTANVARSLARLGHAEDERVAGAIRYCVSVLHELGAVDCRALHPYHLNGYCHMLTPKVLLLLGEVPREMWPEGAEDLRDACVGALRDKRVFRCLPAETREYQESVSALPPEGRGRARERFLSEHAPLHYGEKAGWLRFGFPLSYNSDALEALAALAAVGETWHAEYEPALEAVRAAADAEMRWALRNTFNGKTIADVEKKGRPSRWLTLRALQVLERMSAEGTAGP